MTQTLVLASASPRRKELLSYLDVEFICCAADIDETPQPHEDAFQLVSRLALQKAQATLQLYPQAWVLGSDTVIEHKGNILGKPNSYEQAKDMLLALSDGWHNVVTSIALTNAVDVLQQQIVTEVQFCRITENEIAQYWQTGEPQDKAGSYAIQGIGGKFVNQIRGSHSAVIGLPLVQTKALLKQVGICQ